MKFYVYIYLDPRKSGKYMYGDYCFLYEPFYVGKGKGKRINILRGRNQYFRNKINKIKDYGLEPFIIKLKENLDEHESFILESELIKLIGRRDLDKGPLINFTDGGEGVSGYKHTLITKKILSKSKVGKNNPMFGMNKSKSPRFNKHHSKDTKDKLSKINSGKYHPFYGKHHSNETKNKQSISSRCKNSILNISKVKIIKQILNSSIIKQLKITQKEIGEVFDVSRRTISAINTGQIWSYIREEN